MVNFTKLQLAIAFGSVLLLGAGQQAEARASRDFNLHSFAYKGSASNPFDNARSRMIKNANALMERREGIKAVGELSSPTEAPVPDKSFTKSDVIGDIDGPNGELWYYTGTLKGDSIKENEFYTRFIMREYQFDIYDEVLNHVGTIKDKMEYKDDETGGVPLCDLSPIITKKFFNSDDNYEVVVGLSVNTEVHVNREYSIVYSIGGEKEDGYDKPVMVLNSLVGDVLDASTPEKENYYITFMVDDDEEVPQGDPDTADPDDPDKDGYWKQLTSYGLRMETYGSADETGELRLMWQKRIRLCDLPGDQQDAAYFFTYMKDEKPYFVFSHYSDSYFEPYYGILDDLVMRKDNTFVVEIYTEDNGKFRNVQTTSIPMKINENNENTLCTFYSVGSMLYRQDIQPVEGSELSDLIITTQDKVSGSDDLTNGCYYLYDAEGKLKNTIFEGCESFIPMSNLPGKQAQTMFITVETDGYYYNFVEVPSGKLVARTSYMVPVDEVSDPERLTSNIDRVRIGDTIYYVGELRSPGQDEEGNNFMRVAWLNEDCTLSHIHEINMGQGVHYAQLYIDKAILNPSLFDNDPATFEYMMLIKRSYNSEKKDEELLVGQAITEDSPAGKDLLLLKPDEEKGILQRISPWLNTDSPVLLVSYYNNNTNKISLDFYHLPLLDNSSVGEIPAYGVGDGSCVEFDGSCLTKQGSDITVYSLQGIKLAEGYERVDISDYCAGVYVVRCNGKSVKIVKK